MGGNPVGVSVGVLVLESVYSSKLIEKDLVANVTVYVTSGGVAVVT